MYSFEVKKRELFTPEPGAGIHQVPAGHWRPLLRGHNGQHQQAYNDDSC
jgi:hypothetical protein